MAPSLSRGQLQTPGYCHLPAYDALWCSLAGDFLVQRLVLTSEKVSYPDQDLPLHSYLEESLKQKDLAPEMPFSPYFQKLERLLR